MIYHVDKTGYKKEENMALVEFEPEAHFLQRRIPKIGKHQAEDKNAGHRERLRKRFEKSRFEGFNDYEVVMFKSQN